MYELIIVGGGPAGLTAAVYTARKKVNVLLLAHELGGQPNRTNGVENYMGYQYVEGPELMHKFSQQVSQFPIEQRIGPEVTRITRDSDGFKVQADTSEIFAARTVIIATGKRPRELNVPGEQQYMGKGVTYCAICDGPVFAGRKVAVIGGGNSALEAALDMSKIAEHVYLVSNGPLSGDAVLIEHVKGVSNLTTYLRHEVLEVEGGQFVTSIRAKDLDSVQEKRVTVEGVFVEIGLTPNSEPVAGLAALNRAREIMVTPACETNVPGLFAAGDVTDVPEKQIVVAAGEGAKAALQAHRYLQRLGAKQ